MAAPSGLPRAPLRPKGGTVSGIATVSIGETGMRQALARIAAGEAAEDQEAPEAVVCRRTSEASRHACADLIGGSLSGRCLAEKGCDLG